MYKTRLQELCHRRRWPPPEYVCRRDGPDHDPRFHATVAVNGAEFHSPDPAVRTSKEAHNLAAMAAFEHLSSLETPAAAPVPPPAAAAAARPPESQIPYKSQLQRYAHKRSKELPLYSSIREGPPHAPLFKATVTIDRQTFGSPQYYHTIKEAETAAAHVALMSLPPDVNQPEQLPVVSGFYKNLLQELTQKEGFSLPIYVTAIDGSSYLPSFTSTVEIEGESFQGEPAKTKKQAEMNAAKIAWDHLKERRDNRLSNSALANSHMQKGTGHLSAGQLITRKLEEPNSPIAQVSMAKTHKKNDAENHGSSSFSSTKPLPDGDKTKSLDEHVETAKSEDDGLAPLQKPSTEVKVKEDSMERTLYVDDHSASFNISDRAMATTVPASSTRCDNCSSLSNRVAVYPRRPDLVLPKGATLLPFSDDMWVAVSLDFSNHEGGISV